jgi:LysR substrate binding domain.
MLVIAPSDRTGITQHEAIKRMVAAGAGIGYVSRLSVKQELASASWLRFIAPSCR